MSANENDAKKKSLWEIINSGFFLWVLSSLVIGGFTKWYQFNQKQNKLEEKVKSIDFEIKSRLSQFLLAVEPLVKFTSDSTYIFRHDSSRKVFADLWNDMKRSPSESKYFFSTYTDYDHSSLVALILLQSQTLSDLGHDVNEVKENCFQNGDNFKTANLNDEICKMRGAGRMIMISSIGDFQRDDQSDIESMMEIIYQKVILFRWTMTFPYVDCGYKHPFC